MKVILTLTFVLFFGATALAQNINSESKVIPIIKDVVLLTEIKVENKKESAKDNTIARVHKFKNTRVKKALAFQTKRSSKIA